MVQKYHDANADKITDFKNLLQGNRQSNPGDYLCTVLMMNCKVTALQKKITDTIEKKEIYNWMEANDFKGSRDEAIRRVVSDRYEKYIDEQIGKKKIDITL